MEFCRTITSWELGAALPDANEAQYAVPFDTDSFSRAVSESDVAVEIDEVTMLGAGRALLKTADSM